MCCPALQGLSALDRSKNVVIVTEPVSNGCLCSYVTVAEVISHWMVQSDHCE